MTENTPLTGRVALVTGASRGLGYATAKALAAAGAHVIITARTRGGLEALDDEITAAGGSATLVPMDLMGPDTVEKLAEAVSERWGKLDILVANAGVLGKLMPAHQIPSKVWNEVMAVNVIAPARLIRAFEPLLRQSDAGRAIFVTTSQAARTRAYWAAYGASKAGLEALVQSWAAEIADSGIKVNLFDPGRVRTAMRTRAVPGEDPQSVPLPETVTPLIVELASPAEKRHGEVVRAGR